jgi:protein-S-isoprenylcysteine O-methyltransferase Ste14
MIHIYYDLDIVKKNKKVWGFPYLNFRHFHYYHHLAAYFAFG